MNSNNYLELIADINSEIGITPLNKRIEKLRRLDSGELSFSDDLKKLMAVNNTLSPAPNLNADQLDMVLTTFKHIELTSRLYAMNPKDGKGISWQRDNNSDVVWDDAAITDGFLKYNNNKTPKTEYYSSLTFSVIEKYTLWLVRTNSYNVTINQLDFSVGATINQLVEDIVGIVAAGSPILQIIKKFSGSENEKGVKKGLELSFKYKKENKTERLYQISPVGVYSQMLSFVATYFITKEQVKESNSIFEFAFHHRNQMSAAGGMLLHYDITTWGSYSQKIKEAMKKHEDSIMDGVFDLY